MTTYAQPLARYGATYGRASLAAALPPSYTTTGDVTYSQSVQASGPDARSSFVCAMNQSTSTLHLSLRAARSLARRKKARSVRMSAARGRTRSLFLSSN